MKTKFDNIVKGADKFIKEAPQKIQEAGNYIYENRQGFVAIGIAAYYTYYVLSDMHYRGLKNKLIKAEIKSKTAYAKNFGVK